VRAPICLIVNPAAGGGKAGRLGPEVERTLRGHGLQVRRVDTRDMQHARDAAAAAASAGDTVVALSGDGMVGAIAGVLREVPGSVLGVLPGGRGNDLARVLGISDDAKAACATIAAGETRAMDVGEVVEVGREGSPRTFVGIASAGFDSDANRIANEAPPWLGGLVYAYAALRALLAWKPARFEIELDPPAPARAFSAYSVGAANSRAYGGGMHAAPDAMLDDGLLEVVLLESVGKLTFLTKILPRVFKGTHVELPYVHVFRAEQVQIAAGRTFTMYADGDPIGELPVRVRAVRGALRVIVPPQEQLESAFASSSTTGPAHGPAEPASAGPAHGPAEPASAGPAHDSP
jgi:YegS/Rv2252/BmrU family lipid kinase